MKALIFTLFCFTALNGLAQQIVPISSGETISIRGLSVVDDQTLWVSGTKGKVGLSKDGGRSWNWHQVKGFEKTDFRDIEAFDDRTALIIGIDSPGVILKTKDGGQNWTVVYRDDQHGVFMDAMDFTKDGRGIVVGDPIQRKPYILTTSDFGDHWTSYTDHNIPDLKEGESMFASSGTNVRFIDKHKTVLITGGKSSRILMNKKWVDLPLLQGQTSTGANSIAVSKKRFIVVGGDFTKDTLQQGNAVISSNGKDWQVPTTPPKGYRSCVEYIGGKTFIACGTSGVDISYDNGNNWMQISKESFHIVRKAKKGQAVYLAGTKGHIAVLK